MWTCLSPSSGQYTVFSEEWFKRCKVVKKILSNAKTLGGGGGDFIQYLIALNSSNGNARVLQLSRDQRSETFVNSALRLKVLQCCVLICCVRVCGALHAWNDSRVTASHTYVYCEKQVWMRRGCFEFRSTRSHLHGGGRAHCSHILYPDIRNNRVMNFIPLFGGMQMCVFRLFKGCCEFCYMIMNGIQSQVVTSAAFHPSPNTFQPRSECETVDPNKSFMFATKAVCLLVRVRACLRPARGEMKGLSEANRLPRLPFWTAQHVWRTGGEQQKVLMALWRPHADR